MTADWSPLRRRLREMRANGTQLPIWWRDDDAVAPTPALERLAALSTESGLPVHIAVIPALATKDLAATVCRDPHLIPLVHGWRHDNTAPAGQKKSEFGTRRKGGADELRAALARMGALFGPDFLPVFVPPWNRIGERYVSGLARNGYKGVSTFTARRARCAAPGLLQINTHVDPIDWHGTRDLKDADWLIAQTVDILSARQRLEQDATEPLGYLTHHLVHSEGLWEFSRQYVAELLEGGAVPQAIGTLLETLDEPT